MIAKNAGTRIVTRRYRWLLTAIVCACLIGAAALAGEDGRELSGAELLEILPGKTLNGFSRNGEWRWKLKAGGVGLQIWDNGGAHQMTWSVRDNKLCHIFKDGRKPGKENCRSVRHNGGNSYVIINRKGVRSPFNLME